MCADSQRIRVAVFYDAGLVRSGLSALLDRMAGVEVVGEAEDIPELLRVMREDRPQILVTHDSISTLNWFASASVLRKDFPELKFLLVSQNTGRHIRQALRRGFAGFVLLTAAPDELESAIRAIAEGQTYLSRDVDLAADQVSEQRSKEMSLQSLSPRQREVLQLIAEGKSTKQIATILNISAKTVETHREILMSKLDIRDIAGLVRYAINNGLVE